MRDFHLSSSQLWCDGSVPVVWFLLVGVNAGACQSQNVRSNIEMTGKSGLRTIKAAATALAAVWFVKSEYAISN